MKTFTVRAVLVTGAYVASAVAVLAVIVLLRRAVSAGTLRDILGFYFVAALAAGLEPATVKGELLSAGTLPADTVAVLGAGAIKALVVSPVLGVIWRVADPGISLDSLLLTPLIAIAGFWATELRVMADVRGAHAWAVWLKQGSLAGGFILLALMVGLGAPLFWAILISSLARIIPPAALAILGGRVLEGLQAVPRYLRNRRWPALAAVSAIAAAGGSIDRIVALRWLPATTSGGYFLLYEIFSRFWLIPYLIGPILFARLASGRDNEAFSRIAWRFTTAATAAFVGLVAMMVLGAPRSLTGLLHLAVGPAVIAFAAAIGLGAMTQLRVAELQASGAGRQALLVSATGALVSMIAFYEGVRIAGAEGLLWAWLIKSGVELAVAMTAGRRRPSA